MFDTEKLAVELLGIAGEDGLSINPQALTAAAVDGKKAAAIVRPASGEQAAEFLRYAHHNGLKVAIRGGGTHTNLGNPIAGLDLIISTDRLSAITEYSRSDLMIGTQAGVQLSVLQNELEKNGQFLPVETPSSDQGATIGGAIAANSSGPGRLAYGPARDWLIGTKCVLADGTMVKAGGRVVKNVAGYDMNKLYIGSLGTLGLIYEMNFKLLPLPPAFGTLIMTFDSINTACEVALKIIDTGVFPTALTVLDRGGAQAINLPAAEATLLVEVRNTRLAVERQMRDASELGRRANSRGIEQAGERAAQKEVWQQVNGFGYRQSLVGASLTLKVSSLPDGSAELLTRAKRLAGENDLELQSLSHAGHGLTWLTISYSNEDGALKFVRELSSWSEGTGGAVAVERSPLALKQRLDDVWGAALTQGELRLMRGIKQKLDPQNTLNPGRFAGKL